ARIDEHHGKDAVLQPQDRYHSRKRDEEQRRRNQISEKDRDPQPLTPPSGQAGKGVGGREGEEKRNRDDERTHERGIAQPPNEPGLYEQETQMFERGREVEEERIVLDGVQVEVLL